MAEISTSGSANKVVLRKKITPRAIFQKGVVLDPSQVIDIRPGSASNFIDLAIAIQHQPVIVPGRAHIKEGKLTVTLRAKR